MRFLPLVFLLSVSSLVAQSTLAPLPPDGFVTLTQIISDFSSQPDAALQKYQGQRVLVYGRVGQIAQSQDSQGDPLTVFLQQAENTTPDVKCVFPLAELPGWAQNATVEIPDDGSQAVVVRRNHEGEATPQAPFVIVGQNVGIRGTVENFVAGDIVLKDCQKEHTEKLMKVLKEHSIATE